MNGKIVPLAFLSLFVFVSVEARAVDCDSEVLNQREVHRFPGEGYWLQSAGDCRVTFTGLGGIKTQMYNLCTRKREPITDYIDGFPLPGGELYVHPGMGFYRFKDAQETGGKNMPFYSDRDLRGVYESVGELPGSTPEKQKIRIAVGWEAGLYRDYEITKIDGKHSVKPIGKVKTACKASIQGGLDKEIPVLSRDGQMISTRNLQTRKTEIYRIEEGEKCSLVRALDFQTSKISFSYDNKSVLYVVQDPTTYKGRLLQTDLATGETVTVSGPQEDVKYMSYKTDGSILYTRSPKELVVLDAGSVGERFRSAELEAAGLLWAKECRKTIDADYALAVGMRMNQKDCLSLVKAGAIKSLPGDYATFEPGDLTAACNDKQSADNQKSTQQTDGSKSSQ